MEGEAKVYKHEVPGVVYHHEVLQFQIPMRYLLGVHISHCCNHLPEDYPCFALGKNLEVAKSIVELSSFAEAIYLNAYSITRNRLF